MPEARIAVLDGASGEPLRGVTVELIRRYGWEEDIYTTASITDAQGVARFQKAMETDWVAPLMMHGVPPLDWAACLDIDEPRALELRSSAWSDRGARLEATLELVEGEPPPCWHHL